MHHRIRSVHVGSQRSDRRRSLPGLPESPRRQTRHRRRTRTTPHLRGSRAVGPVGRQDRLVQASLHGDGCADRGASHPTGAEKLHHFGSTASRTCSLLPIRDEAALEQIHDAWVDVCGEAREVTWAHFLMLAGIPGVRSEYGCGHVHQRHTRHFGSHRRRPGRGDPRQRRRANSVWIRTNWTMRSGGGCRRTRGISKRPPEYQLTASHTKLRWSA